MTTQYTPNNKTITDLIEWALEHGYNPYTSITSLPERRDRLYKAYIAICAPCKKDETQPV